MKLVPRLAVLYGSLSVSALLLDGGMVQGAASITGSVSCRPGYPDICVGPSYRSSPSPGLICYDDAGENCTTFYTGGWNWGYDLVEGLPHGATESNDADKVFPTDFETGLEINVRREDDGTTCSVRVGNETCSTCTVCDFDETMLSADCKDIENGRVVECEPVWEPFFYPLMLPSNATAAPSNATAAPAETTSSPTAAPDSSSARTFSMIVLLGTITVSTAAGLLIF